MWLTNQSSTLTCFFSEGWFNFSSFFPFPRSKQVFNFFLDTRYFSCYANADTISGLLLFSVVDWSKCDWFLTENEREKEREREGVTIDIWVSRLIPTRLFDLGDQIFLPVRVHRRMHSPSLKNTMPSRLPSLTVEFFLTSHRSDILLLLKILRLKNFKQSRMNFKRRQLFSLRFSFYFVCLCGQTSDSVHLFIDFILFGLTESSICRFLSSEISFKPSSTIM